MNSDFEKNLSTLQQSLYSFIFSVIPHKQDAEDVLQSTNLAICKNSDRFDPEKGSFSSWAFAVARYQILGHRTKHARSRLCFSNELTETLVCEYNPDKEVNLELQKTTLDSCLQKLPDHMKSIAFLRFKKDLSMKEISQATSRPIGSVSATLFRIRANISNCFRAEYDRVEKKHYKSIN
jgi:RNA polymerase sigma-70 factor (ECF subfamily)